jgi:hypothetical protein
MCHRLAAHRLEELACASQSARPIGGDRVVHHVRCAEPVERRQVIGAQQLVERGQYPLVSSTLIGTLLESSGENTVSPRRVRPARQHSAHTTHIGDRERYAVYRHVSSTRRHRRRRTGGPGRGRLRLRHARLGHTQHRSVRPTRRGTARTTRAAPRRPREHPVGRSAARDGRCEVARERHERSIWLTDRVSPVIRNPRDVLCAWISWAIWWLSRGAHGRRVTPPPQSPRRLSVPATTRKPCRSSAADLLEVPNRRAVWRDGEMAQYADIHSRPVNCHSAGLDDLGHGEDRIPGTLLRGPADKMTRRDRVPGCVASCERPVERVRDVKCVGGEDPVELFVEDQVDRRCVRGARALRQRRNGHCVVLRDAAAT